MSLAERKSFSNDLKRDRIRKEAYLIYLRRARAGIPGTAEQDWYNAEIMVNQIESRGAGADPFGIELSTFINSLYSK